MTYDMNIEQIKSLLARFYEGQTTPEEERLLADFFHREDVPEDLQEDKQLFLLLAQTSDQEMPQDIAEEINASPGYGLHLSASSVFSFHRPCEQ